jgi:hypothetical protein
VLHADLSDWFGRRIVIVSMKRCATQNAPIYTLSPESALRNRVPKIIQFIVYVQAAATIISAWKWTTQSTR